jgi:hypothetical protein
VDQYREERWSRIDKRFREWARGETRPILDKLRAHPDRPLSGSVVSDEATADAVTILLQDYARMTGRKAQVWEGRYGMVYYAFSRQLGPTAELSPVVGEVGP